MVSVVLSAIVGVATQTILCACNYVSEQVSELIEWVCKGSISVYINDYGTAYVRVCITAYVSEARALPENSSSSSS